MATARGASSPTSTIDEGNASVVTTLRHERQTEAPTMPGGQLEIEPPPELAPHEGIGGALVMALPMLASVGAIVFVSAANPGGRGLIAGGMFLVAMLGFVGVQIDRQRKQRSTKVVGARREYLTYLAGVRKTARAAADQQRAAQTWRHPEPSSLPALAAEHSGLWERASDSPDLLHVRSGVDPQPLALELVPPETQAVEQLDPVAVSALHRLLVVHRVQADLPAAVDLRAFARVEVTGDDEWVRVLARSLVCQATAFHHPDQLAVAVLAPEDDLEHWEWAKWLPHTASSEERDAVGPSRMIAPTLDELAPLLPAELADRPRFGADQPPPTPHLLLVVDGAGMPPGNHDIPEEGMHGVTVLELPTRWGELVDEQRLRFHLEEQSLDRGRTAASALRLSEPPLKVAADQLGAVSAEAFARRLAPMSEGRGPARGAGATQAVAELTDLLGLGDVRDISEILTKKPEFIELFVAIGRLGRSLGLHLLLASQRLEEGRLRGLESHLSYRIGLRTFSAAESRTVIGVPDAYELPPTPGLGYLKPDPSTLQRFRASYVSGPPPRRAEVPAGTSEGSTRILPFTSRPVFAPLEEAAEPLPEPTATAVMHVVRALVTDTDEGRTLSETITDSLQVRDWEMPA